MLAAPKCTTEGVGYLVECWPCRQVGNEYVYVGESSRSGYQRAKEHLQEITLGMKTHSIVIHFEEVQQDQHQNILMRVVDS